MSTKKEDHGDHGGNPGPNPAARLGRDVGKKDLGTKKKNS